MNNLLVKSTLPTAVAGGVLVILGTLFTAMFWYKSSPEYLKAQEAFDNNVATPLCSQLRKLKIDAMTVSTLKGLDDYKVRRLYRHKVNAVSDAYKEEMKQEILSRKGHKDYYLAYSDGVDKVVSKCSRWEN